MAEPEPETDSAGNWHWDPSQCEARAARVTMNSEGGFVWPLECEDAPGATPTEDISDPFIDNFMSAQVAQFGLKGLLMIITRTDNSNVVVYKVRVRHLSSRCVQHWPDWLFACGRPTSPVT